MIYNRQILIVASLLLISTCSQTYARTEIDIDPGKLPGGGSSTVGAPAHCVAGHRVGQIELAVNNNGTFGLGFTVAQRVDCFTGGGVSSCEYPKGSNVEYLFAGAFWIGAVVGRDTLVSVGADGWNFAREMAPDESPFGDMIYRSIIDPSKPEYEGAISEEDYICTYSDTHTEGMELDVVSGRPHVPLNIEVTQASYAWSYSYAEDLVLFDYKIRNIGHRPLENVYMGVYVDADVCFDCNSTSGWTDDICGFVHTSPAYCEKCEYVNEVNTAWIADNDGDFNKLGQARDVTATKIVRTPAEELDVSFNWWISNGASAFDFGPREQANKGRWKEDFRDFGGFLGTPEGDANKYYIMRNQEFDYDQSETAMKGGPDDTLWLDPGDYAARFATGYDTRYLLSFGPFDINPGDILPISLSYLAGEQLHQDINNLDNLPDRPDLFYQNLHFDSLSSNARWASWIYDNPGVDTDSDGYSGEMFICVSDSALTDSTAIPDTDPIQWEYVYNVLDSDTCWITGDGVPDFRGASPPPAPKMWVTPLEGGIHIRFNGQRSETTRDLFSNLIDFEGYRVYIARDERSVSYSVVTSYDLEDYNKIVWNTKKIGGAGYQLLEKPFTRRQLQCLYGSTCDGDDFDPGAYSRSSPFVPPGYPDSMFYFEPQDFNAYQFTSDGIHKPEQYAGQLRPTTLIPEDADPDDLTEDGYFKFFEYEFTIRNLLPTVPYWVNVTAFDYGSPSSGLGSLETSVTIGAISAYPAASADEVVAGSLKTYVYPNPYRIDSEYSQEGFENLPDGKNSEDRLRRIHFANLPPQCTIRIYSLDGDLVREIEHDVPLSNSTASHETWDLITRNTQMVSSGLYYWTIEDNNGNVQTGKLAIIL